MSQDLTFLRRALAKANDDKKRLIEIIYRLDAKYDGMLTSREKSLVQIVEEEMSDRERNGGL